MAKHEQTFDSTCLNFAVWDDETKILSLYFRDDRGPYDYADFTEKEWEQMKDHYRRLGAGDWWNQVMKGNWTRRIKKDG